MGKRSKVRHRGKNRGSKRQTNLTTSHTATAAASSDAPSVETIASPTRSDEPSSEQIKECLDKAEYETVIALLREEESKHPLADNQLTDLANALLFGDRERYPDSALEALARIKTHSARSRRIEIWCYMGKAEWDKAIELAEKLLTVDDTFPTRYALCLALLKDRATYALFYAYGEDGEKEEKGRTLARLKEVLESAVEQKGCFPECFCWLEQIWREEVRPDGKDFSRGIELLERALSIYPNEEQIRYQLADRLAESGNRKAAVELLRWVFSATSASGAVFLQGCEIASRDGDFDAALGFIEAAEKVDLVSGWGKDLRKADLLQKSGRLEEAASLYQSVRANAEDLNAKFAALTRLTLIEAEKGDVDSFVDHLSKTVLAWLDCRNTGKPSDGFKTVTIDYKDAYYVRQLYAYEFYEQHDDTMKLAGIVIQRLPEIEHRISDLTRARLFYLFHKGCQLYQEHELQPQILEQLIKHAHLLNSEDVWSDIEVASKDAGDILAAFDAHINYCLVALDKGVEFNPYFESGEWSEDWEELPLEQCLDKVNKKVSTNIHKNFLKHLKVGSQKAKEAIFLPLFIENLYPLFVAHQMHKQVVEACEKLIADFPDDPKLLWKHAFYSHELELSPAAEKSYRRLLELQPEHYSALHNLALILRNRRALKEALEFSDKAVSLATEDKLLADLNKSIRADIDLEAQAKAKWEEVDFYKRKILYHLRQSEFRNYASLTKKTGIDEKALRGHCRRLVEQGWLTEISDRHCKISRMLWLLPYDLLTQALDTTYRGRTAAPSRSSQTYTSDFDGSQGIRTTFVSAGSREVIKPVFNSQNEYRFYCEFVHLFPNHMVIPNMALQSVFRYDVMKGLLSSEDFRYYLMAQVDICIVSLKDFRPRYAFEIDSVFHDSQEQMVRDDRKDRIFRVGGVPFIRMRPFGFTTDEDIRKEIVKAMRALPEVFNSESPNLSLELDTAIDDLEGDGVF